jgi:hypothetical protein
MICSRLLDPCGMIALLLVGLLVALLVALLMLGSHWVGVLTSHRDENVTGLSTCAGFQALWLQKKRDERCRDGCKKVGYVRCLAGQHERTRMTGIPRSGHLPLLSDAMHPIITLNLRQPSTIVHFRTPLLTPMTVSLVCENMQHTVRSSSCIMYKHALHTSGRRPLLPS